MSQRPDMEAGVLTVASVRDLHLRDYLKVLRRRWRSACAAFAAVFTSIALYTVWVRPVYEAETLLQVSEGARGAAIIGELAGLNGPSNPVETEMEVLRSRSLASEVVKALGLDLVLRAMGGGIFSGTQDRDRLEFPRLLKLSLPGELMGEEITLSFDGQGRGFTLERKGETLLSGIIGGTVGTGELAIRIQDGYGFPSARFLLQKNDLRVASAELLDNLNVSQVGRNTGVVRLTFCSTDPSLAAAVLETINRLYVNRDVSESSRDAVVTLDFITEQLEQVKDDLGRSQSLLDNYKISTGAVALSQEAELLVGRISDLEVEVNRLNVRRQGLESLLESISQGPADLAAGISALDIESPELASLVSEYSRLTRKREELTREFTPQNPLLAAVDSQIELSATQIRTTAVAIRGGLERRLEAVKGVLDNYRRQLSRLPEMERNLAKLQKDVLIQEKIYSFLLEKEQETEILRASTVSTIRIVDPPTVPIEPIRPRTGLNLVFGLLLALLLGTGVAFFVDYLDDSVKDVEDMEGRVGMPVYGVIPFVRKAHERRKQKKPHLVIEEMHAPVTEAFRTLRTNLFFSRDGKALKTVAVTSPGPGAGKSFVVANVAALSALLGKRTLVIDADMRHPQQHVVLGASQGPGLSEVLVEPMDLRDAVQETRVKDLAVLTSGAIPPNPAELLGSEKMIALLHRASEIYDLVIIDTPPINLVVDPVVLAKMTQFTLMVARSGATTFKEIERALGQLKTVQVSSAGSLLNAVRAVELGYGKTYYRYGEG